MRDADWSFGMLALLAITVTVYFARTLVLGRARNSRVDADGGSLLVAKGFMEFGYWLMGPIVSGLARAGITPDQVTALSLVPALAAGVAVANGRFGLACWLSTGASMCDSIDGLLARRVGTASDAGEAFDAVADRYVEFFFIGGLVVHYRGSLGLSLLALASMMGAYLISYSTAKAEAIGVPAPRGLMRRAERAIYFGFAAGLTPFAGLLCGPDSPTWQREAPMVLCMLLVGGIANLSAVSRLRQIMASVRARDALRALPGPAPMPVSSLPGATPGVGAAVAATASGAAGGAGGAETKRSFG
jgi:phosphatidylglycerophosphate synthase